VRRIAIKSVEITCLLAGQNGDRQARKEVSCGERRRWRSSASGRVDDDRDPSPCTHDACFPLSAQKRTSRDIDWYRNRFVRRVRETHFDRSSQSTSNKV